MSQDIRILVKAEIHKQSKAIINQQLKDIQKQIQSLNIKVNVDKSTLKTLESFTHQFKKIEAQAEKTKKVVQEALLPDGTKVKTTHFDGMHKGFQQTIDEAKKFKNVIDQTAKANNQSLESQRRKTEQLTKAIEEQQKIQSKSVTNKPNGNTSTSARYGDKYNNSTVSNTKNGTTVKQNTNYATQERDVQRLTFSLSNLRNQGVITERVFSQMLNGVNGAKTEKQLNRINEAMKRVQATANNKAKVSNYQDNAKINAQNLQTQYGKNVDSSAVDRYLASVSKLKADSPRLAQELARLNTEFRQIQANARQAADSTKGLGEMLRDAAGRIALFGGVSTIFFGITNAVSSTVSTLVDLDTKITNIQKVMSEDTNFDSIFNRAAESADNFAKSLSDTLDAYTEFTKNGWKGEDLGNLGDAALVASNVGEISAQQSAEYLTSAIVQYKLEAKDAMSVIDKFNEVANKNGTTVENLAQGMARSASVTKIYGMDMDEAAAAIGTVTEATKQSGNEVGNFLKNVLPRLNSEPAQAALKSLNIESVDSSGNMRDAMDIYAEVAKKVENIGTAEKMAVLEGLAGKYHISRMAALIDNMDRYNKMLSESQNSQGSAERENERYMKSMQAKINLAKKEFEMLAMAIGQAFANDAILGVLSGVSALASGVTKLIEVFGFLPTVIGAVVTAMLLLGKGGTILRIWHAGVSGLSGAYAGLTSRIGMATVAMRAQQAGVTGLTGTLRGAAGAAVGLSTALRGVMASTGIGLLFVGIGVGVEKAISAISNYNTKQKEMKKANDDMAKSYTNNSTEINKLVADYERLNSTYANAKPKEMEGDEGYQEYLDVQNRLNQLMPSMTHHVDRQNQAHLQSVDRVKEELNYAKQLRDTYARQQADNFGNDVEKKTKEFNKQLEAVRQIKREQQGQGSVVQSKYGLPDKSIEKQREFVAGERELQLMLYESTDFLKQRAQSFLEVSGASQKLTDEQKKLVDGFVEQKIAAADATKEGFDYEKFLTNTANQAADFGEKLAKIPSPLLNMFDANEINELSKKQLNALNKMKTDLENGADFSQGTDTYKHYKKALEDLNLPASTVKKMLDEMAAAHTKNAQATKEDTRSHEELVNTYNNSISSIQTLRQIHDDLVDGYSLSSQQLGFLLEKYPDLLAYLGNEEALRANVNKKLVEEQNTAAEVIYSKIKDNENYFNTVLKGNKSFFDQLGKMYGVDLNNSKTLAQAKHKVEMSVIRSLAASWRDYYRAYRVQTEGSGIWGKLKGAIGIGKQVANDYKVQTNAAADHFNQITMNTGAIDLNSIGLEQNTRESVENAVATQENSEATEDNIEEIKEYTYVANKQQQAIEKVSKSIDAQNRLRNRYSRDSAQYRKTIQDEIKLLQQQNQLYQEQYNSLNKQIQSGKLTEYGVVQTGSTFVNTGGGGSYSGGGGTYTGKYASSINKYASQYGVDPFLIAAIIKTESNFNPNARSGAGAVGLMQLMPATARELGVSNRSNPDQSIMGGTKYIAQMLKRVGGDITKALYSYNGGPGYRRNANGTPIAKETRNYAGKVLSAYQQLSGSSFSSSVGNAVGASAGQAITKTLSGWSGKITSTYGMRTLKGETKMHHGIDIAGKAGTPLDSNVSGKVVYSGWGAKGSGYGDYGNVVAISDAQGNVHLYAHLDGTKVKTGDYVSAGQRIGSIGNTGRSYGAHLHYEIRKNGQLGNTFNPMSYAQQAKAGKIIAGGSSRSISSSLYDGVNYSQINAQNQQSLDEARAQLADIQSQIGGNSDKILQLNADLADSWILQYDRIKEKYDQYLQNGDVRLSRLDPSGGAYRTEIEKQVKAMQEKLKVSDDQEKMVRKLASAGNVSGEYLQTLYTRIHELGNEQNEIEDQIKEWNSKKVTSLSEYFQEKAQDYADVLENGAFRLARLDSSSAAYRKELNNQIKTIKAQKNALDSQQSILQAQVNSKSLSADYKKQLKQQIHEISVERNTLLEQTKEWNGKIVDSLNQHFEEQTKKYIDTVSNGSFRLARLDPSSSGYRKELDNQVKAMQTQKKIMLEHQATLEAYSNSGLLTPEYKKQLKQQIQDIATERNALIEQVKEWNGKVVDSLNMYYEEQTKKYTNFIENGAFRLARLDSSSAAYRAELERQIKAMQDQKKVMTEHQSVLETYVTSGLLTPEYIKNLKEMIQSISLSRNELTEQIKEWSGKVVDSSMLSYQERIEKEQYNLDASNARIDRLNNTSKDYIDTLGRQLAIMGREEDIINDQYVALQRYYKTLEFTAEKKKELEGTIRDVNMQLLEMQRNMRQLTLDMENFRIDRILEKTEEATRRINYYLAELDRNLGKIELKGTRGAQRIIQNNVKKINELHDLRKSAEQNIKALEIQLKVTTQPEAQKRLKEELENWKNQLREIQWQAEDVETAMLDMRKQVASQAIEALKQSYEQQRKLQLDAIDKQMKEEDKRHNKVVENLNDELEAYRKTINGMIDEMDKADATRSYEKEMKELQDKRLKLEDEIEVRSLDTSHESIAKQKELQEELDEVLKDIEEARYQRDLELRKENLQDMLEKKEEETQKHQEEEDKKYEATREAYEKQQEEINNKFDEMLNDTRRFAELEKQIITGNVTAITDEFRGLISFMQDNMPEIGKTIQEGIIDQLKEALDLLKQVPSSTRLPEYDQPTKSRTMSDADLKVVAGKFMNDYLTTTESGSKHADSLRDKGHDLAAEGRKEGSTIAKDKGFQELLNTMSDADKKAFMELIKGDKVYGNIITSGIKGDILDYAGNIQKGSDFSYADMKVLAGKFLTDYVTKTAEGSEHVKSLQEKGHSLAMAGRNEGSTLAKDKGFQELIGSLSEENKRAFMEFLMGNNVYGNIITPEIRDEIERYTGSLDSDRSMSAADLKVLAGKFMIDYLRLTPYGQEHQQGLLDKGHALGNQGRKEGSTVDVNTGIQRFISTLSKEDQMAFADYLASGDVFGNIITPELKNLIAEYTNTLLQTGISMPSGDKYGQEPEIPNFSKGFGNGDFAVLSAKYLIDVLGKTQAGQDHYAGLQDKAYALAETGRKIGSQLDKSKGFDQLAKLMSKEDKLNFATYLERYVYPRFLTPDLKNTMQQYTDKLRIEGTYHEGGITGTGQSISKETEFANELLNGKLKPNEMLAKVLKGELWSPQANIQNKFIPNLKKLVGMASSPAVALAGGGDTIINLGGINIDKLMGDEQGAETVANAFVKKLKLGGMKI
ncbi:phage tail tape measure protein [Priestia endophytica]